MHYTVPIVVEKALALLDVKPLAVHYADHCDVNGFSPNYRGRGLTPPAGPGTASTFPPGPRRPGSCPPAKGTAR